MLARLDYESESPKREIDPFLLSLAWVGSCMTGAVGGAVAAAFFRWHPEVWNTIAGKSFVGGGLTIFVGVPLAFLNSLRLSTRVLIGCLSAFAVTFLLCHFVFTSW